MFVRAQADYGPRLVHTPAFETKAWEGLDKMYAMDWAGAEAVFRELEWQHPDHPAPPFVRAANLWWQVSLDYSYTGYDKEMFAQLELAISRCERLLEKGKKEGREGDFEADFLLFGALGYKARLLAARGSYWSAGNVALKSLGPLKRGMKNKDKLTEFLFGSGLYNYFVVWYGEYRPIMRPLLGLFPRGDKALGLRELEASAQVRNYTQIESATFLCEIHSNFEHNHALAAKLSEQLAVRYPSNVLFAYYRARSAFELGHYAEARAQIAPLLARYPATDPTVPIRVNGGALTTQLFAWLALLQGEVELAEKHPAEALRWLDRAHRAVQSLGWDENEWRARILLQRGIAQDRLGRRNDALWSYKTAIGIDACPKPVKAKAEGCVISPCK